MNALKRGVTHFIDIIVAYRMLFWAGLFGGVTNLVVDMFTHWMHGRPWWYIISNAMGSGLLSMIILYFMFRRKVNAHDPMFTPRWKWRFDMDEDGMLLMDRIEAYCLKNRVPHRMRSIYSPQRPNDRVNEWRETEVAFVHQNDLIKCRLYS